MMLGKLRKLGGYECSFCDKQAVETEMHFLFECNLYSTLRANFYAEMEVALNNFQTITNEEK